MDATVLLTGASGFVGSRVLAHLLARGISVVPLVRSEARRQALGSLPAGARTCLGNVEDAASLRTALRGCTHVIHCAGLTKALSWAAYEQVNVRGTYNLVEAVNRTPGIRRLVHLSSLAAHGPAVRSSPARESDPPEPVSLYGRSKLEGEDIVREQCRVPFTIFRPPGVYGPGDRDFLQLFQAVKRGVCPVFGGGQQELSLVYADDLAGVLVDSLELDPGPEPVFHVAHDHPLTARELTLEVARQVGARPRVLPLPGLILWLAALGGEAAARVSGRVSVLTLDRLQELRAPGWVCSTSHLQDALGLRCPTSLKQGLAQTATWYREQGWL